MNAAAARLSTHSRQNSQTDTRTAPVEHGSGYVQYLRMTQATVWAGRGPRDAVSNIRKAKPASSAKKGRFGMRIFSGDAKPSKTKLRLYAAPEHTTLVPRLSASEANDGEDDDFRGFTSSAPKQQRPGSIGRSSLHLTASRDVSVPPSPVRKGSIASSNAASYSETLVSTLGPRRSTSQSRMTLPSISRPGSPTQLQQYSVQHVPHDSDDGSDDDSAFRQDNRPKLFIANADVGSDSD